MIVVVAVLAWAGYSHYTQRTPAARPVTAPAAVQRAYAEPARTVEPPAFTCDGRTRCQQMSSCAEATFFLQNCPNTEMDGDRDGVPCEQQWCGRR